MRVGRNEVGKRRVVVSEAALDGARVALHGERRPADGREGDEAEVVRREAARRAARGRPV